MQGDVIAIYNTSGTLQAKYRYDAYGNCTVTNSTNLHLATYNPIRYRGYYWDSETNWYFLNARYYSPEWRRFISPDDTAYIDPFEINDWNLYVYCINNPIMYVDPMGTNASVKAFDGEYDLDDEMYKGTGMGGGTGPQGTVASQYGGNTHNYSSGNSQVFTQNQQALLGLAKEYLKGVSLSEGYTLVGWANEYGISNHGPMVHPNRNGYWANTEHIKIKNWHIPIRD